MMPKGRRSEIQQTLIRSRTHHDRNQIPALLFQGCERRCVVAYREGRTVTICIPALSAVFVIDVSWPQIKMDRLRLRTLRSCQP